MVNREAVGRCLTLGALAGLIFSAAMGVQAYMATASFIAGATHVSATLLPTGPGQQAPEVTFTDELGTLITFTPAAIPAGLAPGPVPVAYSKAPDGQLDARLNFPSLLWARWHDWLGYALFCGFVAVYGKTALTDPGSIIAFKSWHRRRTD